VPLSALANFGDPFTAGISPCATTSTVGADHPAAQRRVIALSRRPRHWKMSSNKHAPRNGLRLMACLSEQKARKGFPHGPSLALAALRILVLLPRCMRAGSFHGAWLLSTPSPVFGALVALWLRRVVLGCSAAVHGQMENDVYTQMV